MFNKKVIYKIKKDKSGNYIKVRDSLIHKKQYSIHIDLKGYISASNTDFTTKTEMRDSYIKLGQYINEFDKKNYSKKYGESNITYRDAGQVEIWDLTDISFDINIKGIYLHTIDGVILKKKSHINTKICKVCNFSKEEYVKYI
jgi:hypothetical protein